MPGTLSSLLSTTFSLSALVQTTGAEFTCGVLFPPVGGQTVPSRKGCSGVSCPGRRALPRRPSTLTVSSASRSRQAKDSFSEMAPKGAENTGRKRASPPCRTQPPTAPSPGPVLGGRLPEGSTACEGRTHAIFPLRRESRG